MEKDAVSLSTTAEALPFRRHASLAAGKDIRDTDISGVGFVSSLMRGRGAHVFVG
jgi:hypothetical protein